MKKVNFILFKNTDFYVFIGWEIEFEWTWDESVKKVKLFGLRERWRDLSKKFVRNMNFLINKIVRLQIYPCD